MSDRGVDPPGASDAEQAEGERRLRKSRRGLRIPTGTQALAPAAVSVAVTPASTDLDLPDLEHEPLLSHADDHADTTDGAEVEITASDEVEVSVSEVDHPPAPAPAPVVSLEPSMRVVRRRIRKVGSDAPPNDDPVVTFESSSSVPPPSAEIVVPARPSRPAPPRASVRPPAITPSASIFTAPTIPPMPDPAAPGFGLGALASSPPPPPAPRPEDDLDLSPDDDLPVMRASDPSLALLDELGDLPIGADAQAPRPSPSRIPPPPPEPSKGQRSMAPPPPPVTASRPLAVTVPDQHRRRRRHWWEDLFNDDYLRTVVPLDAPQVAAEADWIEHALGVEAGASVLDVACGVGRHACELAQRGYEVTGVDLSPTMIQRANAAAHGTPRHPDFVHGDMMALDYDESFDAAYCVGSSFGFFDDQRNADVATRIHRALKDNGTFLLQVINRDHAIQSQPAMAWFEGDGCVCMEESSVNYITSRLNVKRTVIFDDGRQREIEFSVRLYSLHELGQLLHQSGFRILEVSGHVRTPGAFFGPSSRELIILAQKRGAEVIELDHHDGADD